MDEQDEALSARARSRLGSTLRGKYRLDRVLGIGGMATVFAATHRNQAELAVKLLHPELSLRDDLKKRFLREGYVGNSVKHPGAVLVVDDDVAEDGSAFLVMELLRGKSLEELWEREGRALSSRVVTSIALQLLDVLAAAHEKAIVHRDLKPANLFLTVDGSLKVLDFGIARLRDALGGSEHATRTGTLMGTPAFMAPEQAQAIATEIDGQTDLWAVGATMYTLLSGRLVHEGDNSQQLLIRAGTSRAGPISSAAPNVEPAIAEVVDKALTFEKSGRWPSAAAMRDALTAAAMTAFGAPPGRDVLTVLVDEGLPSRTSGDTRIVVSGDVGGHDPTFATPNNNRTPAPVGSLMPPSGTSGSRPSPAVLPGLSTGNAVSAETAPSLAPRRGPAVSTVVTAIAVVVAVATLGYTFLRSPATVAVVVPPVGAAAAATEPPAPSKPAAAVPVPPSPPVPSATALVPSATAEITTAAAAPAPPSPPAVAAAAKAAKTVTTTPAKNANKPAPAVDCSAPYTWSADGQKIWKRECLQ
jgi:serine/threonine-protein kinase